MMGVVDITDVVLSLPFNVTDEGDDDLEEKNMLQIT